MMLFAMSFHLNMIGYSIVCKVCGFGDGGLPEPAKYVAPVPRGHMAADHDRQLSQPHGRQTPQVGGFLTAIQTYTHLHALLIAICFHVMEGDSVLLAISGRSTGL